MKGALCLLSWTAVIRRCFVWIEYPGDGPESMGYNPTLGHGPELPDRLQLSALATATVSAASATPLASATPIAAATAWMDVGGAAMAAKPAAAAAIEPAALFKPWAVAIDNPSAAHRGDAAGPGKLQAGD
jgi:hypothetical protein